MLVTVTGGTGFVGSHSVAALVRAGHTVRLLVRDKATVDPALAPLGVPADAVETVVGDFRDTDSVHRAMRGTEGALHAGSVFSFDTRDHRRMRETNAAGTETVLTAALAAGADPVVHVSSVVALMPSATPLTPQAPVGRPREAYMASKADSERIARQLQEKGAPVVITYPSAVLGPDDPKLGDQTARLRNVLKGLMPMWPLGGFPVADVRDTAALHAALFEPGQGPRRFLGPGHYLSTRDYVRTVREVTGRKIPTIYLPARAMLGVGALVGLVQRALPVHLPAEYGAIYTCACATRLDAVAAAPLGIRPRPAAETFADAIGWLHSQGQLSDRQAGRAAG